MSEKSFSAEEIKAFRETASSFARRTIAGMLAHESPDGDIARMPQILEEGMNIGLLATLQPEASGRETGIWGHASLSQGPAVSLMLLEEMATVCAGTAMVFHAQGLGALPMIRARAGLANPPSWVAMALAEPFGWPSLSTLIDPAQEAPARVETIAEDAEGGVKLSGAKSFVYHAPGTEAFVVFARQARGGWGAYLVSAEDPGLTARDVGPRTGLRAAGLVHLELDEVKISEDRELKFDVPSSEVVMDQVRCNMLGLCAIAIGTARGALTQAVSYARERWQGCAYIIEQPAVRTLLVDSEARIMASQATLARAAQAAGPAQDKLLEAARAKLIIMPQAAGAVTDCLQVFGGYGYMEDYRMEKRLRDVSVLKSAGGSPLELRRMIAEATLAGKC